MSSVRCGPSRADLPGAPLRDLHGRGRRRRGRARRRRLPPWASASSPPTSEAWAPRHRHSCSRRRPRPRLRHLPSPQIAALLTAFSRPASPVRGAAVPQRPGGRPAPVLDILGNPLRARRVRAGAWHRVAVRFRRLQGSAVRRGHGGRTALLHARGRSPGSSISRTVLEPTSRRLPRTASRWPGQVFDGEVTMQSPNRGSFPTPLRLRQAHPGGPGVAPTTDGGERNNWDDLF